MTAKSAFRRREILSLPITVALLSGCGRRLRDPSEVMIGSSPTGVPFSFVDPWTNQLTGSMVDTATAIVAATGGKTGTAITPFSALIPSLVAHKIDMIAAALLRTPERERIVAFSDPVYSYAGTLVVRASERRSFPDLRSLHDVPVGAQIGSRFIDQLTDAGVSNVASYESLVDILRDLENGRIDVAYGDEPILRYQLRVGTRRAVRIVEQFRAPAQEQLCLVMRRGDPRLPAINAAIGRLAADAIPAINRKWGL